MATVRIYKVAELLGTSSQEVVALLKRDPFAKNGDRDNQAHAYTGLALPPSTVGDLNCDGLVNHFDIDPFILGLADPGGYSAAYPRCHLLNGDCNNDGQVTVDELLTLANIALGHAQTSACPHGVPSGEVGIALIVQAFRQRSA